MTSEAGNDNRWAQAGAHAVVRQRQTYDGVLREPGEVIVLLGRGDQRLAEHHYIVPFIDEDPLPCPESDCSRVWANLRALDAHITNEHSKPPTPRRALAAAFVVVKARTGVLYGGERYGHGECFQLRSTAADAELIEGGNVSVVRGRVHLCVTDGCGRMFSGLGDIDAHTVSTHRT